MQHAPPFLGQAPTDLRALVRDNRVEVRVLFGAPRKAPPAGAFRVLGLLDWPGGRTSRGDASDSWSRAAGRRQRDDPIHSHRRRASRSVSAVVAVVLGGRRRGVLGALVRIL